MLPVCDFAVVSGNFWDCVLVVAGPFDWARAGAFGLDGFEVKVVLPLAWPAGYLPREPPIVVVLTAFCSCCFFGSDIVGVDEI